LLFGGRVRSREVILTSWIAGIEFAFVVSDSL